jgi:hypothetical protein
LKIIKKVCSKSYISFKLINYWAELTLGVISNQHRS